MQSDVLQGHGDPILPVLKNDSCPITSPLEVMSFTEVEFKWVEIVYFLLSRIYSINEILNTWPGPRESVHPCCLCLQSTQEVSFWHVRSAIFFCWSTFAARTVLRPPENTAFFFFFKLAWLALTKPSLHRLWHGLSMALYPALRPLKHWRWKHGFLCLCRVFHFKELFILNFSKSRF